MAVLIAFPSFSSSSSRSIQSVLHAIVFVCNFFLSLLVGLVVVSHWAFGIVFPSRSLVVVGFVYMMCVLEVVSRISDTVVCFFSVP